MTDLAAIVDRVRRQVAGGVSTVAWSRAPQPHELTWGERRMEELRADVEGCRADAAWTLTDEGQVDHHEAIAEAAFLDNDIARWRRHRDWAAGLRCRINGIRLSSCNH